MATSSRRRRTLTALADTLFPSIAPEDPPGGDVVPDAFERFARAAKPGTAEQIGVALDLVELGALPLFGRPFSRLPEGARERYLDGMMRSRFALRRALFKSLRDLCGNLYYQDERTWAFLGYEGPPVMGRGL